MGKKIQQENSLDPVLLQQKKNEHMTYILPLSRIDVKERGLALIA